MPDEARIIISLMKKHRSLAFLIILNKPICHHFSLKLLLYVLFKVSYEHTRAFYIHNFPLIYFKPSFDQRLARAPQRKHHYRQIEPRAQPRQPQDRRCFQLRLEQRQLALQPSSLRVPLQPISWA